MPYVVVRELGAERSIPIADPEVQIGRSRQNQVKLVTEQASRQHCKLVRTPQGYRLVDGGSSNGTYVNGQRVSEKDLADGDSIVVGQATVVYKAGEPAKRAPRLPEPGRILMPLEDRNVRILLHTIANASSCQDLDAFIRSALDDVIEIAQAERGVLFMPDAGGSLKPVLARDLGRKTIAELTGLSRTIPQQVFEHRKSIFLLDTENAKEPVQSESVSLYHLRTVMCAPLRVGERILGVLYVDSHAKTREYSATDLAIFEAVTNYLALTMENVRTQHAARGRVEEQKNLLERELAVLRSALTARRHLIGESPAMKAIYESIRKVAPTDATVLVLGESGTGKEAIAHVLHDLSPRSGKPFVVIDCAAIPETLLESELFGYEKGAFTGAVAQKPGKLEVAQGGTVFLDEMGELTLNLQVKLLRALEQRMIGRVGGVDPIPIDIRLVAATNRNLEEMVKAGRFRQDLYFRLKVVSINLPALHERGDDVVLLAEHFLKEACAQNGRSIRGFSDEARGAVRAHRWEGNIRELKHRVEQAVILSNNQYLSTEDLGLVAGAAEFRSLELARDLFEKSYVLQALGRYENNVTHAARALGISRQHLQNLIKKHAIARVADTGDTDQPLPPIQ
jgi:transcriptional regulator with GAF, ATPase, and Fis domain